MNKDQRSPAEIADEVRHRMVLKDLAKGYSYTRRLKSDSSLTFENASRRFQKAGFLTKEDLHEIALWKSPRSAGRIAKNDPTVVKKFTQIAFDLTSDNNLPPSVPLAVLMLLHGVRVPMASTVLTVWDPSRFGVIDVNAWSALFNLAKQRAQPFAAQEFDRYSAILEELRSLTGMKAREIDMALWEWWDKNKKGRR